MAKRIYFGVGDTARKVKGLYIGIDGIARKVKKGYIGVNGVAQQFYSDGIPVTITGSGGARVTHNGTSYTAPASFSVNAGDSITFYSDSSAIGQFIYVNGSMISQQNPYTWRVPDVGAISITTEASSPSMGVTTWRVTTS